MVNDMRMEGSASYRPEEILGEADRRAGINSPRAKTASTRRGQQALSAIGGGSNLGPTLAESVARPETVAESQSQLNAHVKAGERSAAVREQNKLGGAVTGRLAAGDSVDDIVESGVDRGFVEAVSNQLNSNGVRFDRVDPSPVKAGNYQLASSAPDSSAESPRQKQVKSIAAEVREQMKPLVESGEYGSSSLDMIEENHAALAAKRAMGEDYSKESVPEILEAIHKR